MSFLGIDRWLIGDFERDMHDTFLEDADRELHTVAACRPPCPMYCTCECHLFCDEDFLPSPSEEGAGALSAPSRGDSR